MADRLDGRQRRMMSARKRRDGGEGWTPKRFPIWKTPIERLRSSTVNIHGPVVGNGSGGGGHCNRLPTGSIRLKAAAADGDCAVPPPPRLSPLGTIAGLLRHKLLGGVCLARRRLNACARQINDKPNGHSPGSKCSLASALRLLVSSSSSHVIRLASTSSF